MAAHNHLVSVCGWHWNVEFNVKQTKIFHSLSACVLSVKNFKTIIMSKQSPYSQRRVIVVERSLEEIKMQRKQTLNWNQHPRLCVLNCFFVCFFFWKDIDVYDLSTPTPFLYGEGFNYYSHIVYAYLHSCHYNFINVSKFNIFGPRSKLNKSTVSSSSFLI